MNDLLLSFVLRTLTLLKPWLNKYCYLVVWDARKTAKKMLLMKKQSGDTIISEIAIIKHLFFPTKSWFCTKKR